jgi:hypothetical protein
MVSEERPAICQTASMLPDRIAPIAPGMNLKTAVDVS